MSFDKSKIYIALGIISFILIGIGLYFLFIKKKPYDCTKDPNCKSPSKCVDNKCIPYDCTKDPNCESPSKCVDNKCIPYDCTKDTTCKTARTCVDNKCIPYDCTKDPNFTSLSTCVDNKCIPYDCTKDKTCTSPNKCVDNKCATEISDIDLGFINHAYVSSNNGYISMTTNDPDLNLKPNIFKIGDIIKMLDEEFPILSYEKTYPNNFFFITSNKFKIPTVGNTQPFLLIKFN
jgi:hypothetical protein